jgi:hypothetical protein
MKPGFVIDHAHYNRGTFGEWGVGQPAQAGPEPSPLFGRPGAP